MGDAERYGRIPRDYETMRRRLINAIGCDPADKGRLSDLAEMHARQLRQHGDGSPASSWMVEFAKYIDERREP